MTKRRTLAAIGVLLLSALANSSPSWTSWIGRTDDRSRIYFENWYCATVYDASSDTFSGCAEASGSGCAGMTFDATGTRLTFGAEIYDQTLHRLTTVPRGVCSAISPDATTVFATDGANSMRSMALATGQMLERIPLPLTPQRLFVDPNGKWILAFKTASGAQVTRVDLP